MNTESDDVLTLDPKKTLSENGVGKLLRRTLGDDRGQISQIGEIAHSR